MSAATRVLFHPYRFRLAFTYTLSVTEFVLGLLYPFTIGLAINGFLDGRGIISIAPLTAVWLLQAAFSALYQITASRLFAKIYRTIAGKLILGEQNTPDTTSEIAARVIMVEKICDALADEVPLLISGIVGIFGSAVMLFLYDLRVGAVAAALIVIIALLQWWFSIRAVDLNERINTLRESHVKVISQPAPARIRDYFRAITRLNIRFKDVETGAWSIADVFSLGAVVLVLFLVTRNSTFDVGSIYAMVAYVMTLTDSLENAPDLVDEGAHFYDVSLRIATQLRERT
ncbi:ABC transporter transmembrane region [Alkalispirochaeta americana]|uniref:ABC transporter transmembrane region n=1 Tax=Alkalispirochaeta americana TaxID=159291 RepID=A0A1N6Q4Z9_9SPIO|nr:ABC transporter six-transmembrane domain-containing protein [Alkalispirochaeta americana]SIQ11539.1 ABC transporter transmembrane region [Alkalispirochaeta americana]